MLLTLKCEVVRKGHTYLNKPSLIIYNLLLPPGIEGLKVVPTFPRLTL